MRIKLLRTCVVPGCPGAQAGDVVDCDAPVASVLISMQRAIEAPVEPPPVQPIQTRDPIVETRDPGFSVETAPALVKVGKRTRSKLL